MEKRYLILCQHGAGKKIHFTEYENSELCVGNYRVSPIFSVTESFYEPASSESYYAGFIFCEYAFKEIGRLLNELNHDFHNNLYFSHGLASIIFVAKDLEILEKIKGVIGDNIRGYEIWKVDGDCTVEINDTFVCEINDIDLSSYALSNHDILDADISWVLHEYTNCIRTAAYRALQYAPSQAVIFQRLTSSVNSIIEELISLQLQINNGQNIESQEETLAHITEEVSRKKSFYFLASQLVEINSALSYIISQGYSGTVPIFESECHVRNFSLLGIGTAYRALSCFSKHVENIFEGHPVSEIIRERFSSAAAPSPFKPPATKCSDEWDKDTFGIDKYFGNGHFNVEDHPKLVYYSGRQGFRETKFTVSAPINTLNAASSVRWNLMTLSHELMHAHVMSILATLFGGFDSYNTENFSKIVKDFEKYRNNKYRGPINLRDCLCFIILNYCYISQSIDKNYCKKTSTIGLDKISNPEYIKDIFSDSFSEINEILVHVLDYIYFYDQNDEAYIGLLWESWSPVPAVLEKMDKYILRTILAIGTKETGNTHSRYFSSLKILKKYLKDLDNSNPGNIVIKYALSVVDKNEDTSSTLFMKFSPGIYLADMAVIFLASAHINGELLDDTQRIAPEDGSTHLFALEVGTFEEFYIESPVALCDSLLKNSLAQKNTYPIDISSAWSFLACASYMFKERED